MPEAIPVLSESDVRHQLEELLAAGRKHHLVGLFGRMDSETFLDVDEHGRYAVVPVRSELELRKRVVELTEEDPKVVFLLPFTGQIPWDLAGRFVLCGRIRRVGRDARLRRLFKVDAVTEEALESALAGHLADKATDEVYPADGNLLTLPVMWSAWLEKTWGIHTEGGLALDALMSFAARDGSGPQFEKAHGQADAGSLRTELLSFLQDSLGPAGPVIWRAWEQGHGRAPLEYGVLFEVLWDAQAPSEAVDVWTSQRLKYDLALEGADHRVVARALGQSATTAMRLLEKHDPNLARQVVEAADARVDNDQVRKALLPSKRLPSAWHLMLDELGAILSAGAEHPGAKRVDQATDVLKRLQAHDAFTDPKNTGTVKRAEHAVRLLTWLADRSDRRLPKLDSPLAAFEALAGWYAAEGGFLDWSRQAARGSGAKGFGQGVQAVVSAVDQARKDLDLRFAKGLRDWVEAGRPTQRVVPIDEVLSRIGVKFLTGHPDRRLLVLLFDGMGWAQAVELLKSLQEQHWGPLAWHQTKAGKIGDGDLPVVLANLPTTTEVSRAAFFASKPLKPGQKGNTQKDPDRFRDNTTVSKLFAGDKAPKLMLKAEGHTPDGAASEPVLSMVADTTQTVVAVVINAVDDSLGTDPQIQQSWGVASFKPLSDLLSKARQAGRSVLVASDHGHARVDRMESCKQEDKGGSRWRPRYKSDEPLQDHEVALQGPGVWWPKGADGVILLADEEHCYGKPPKSGAHGGSTLAEVVIPGFLLGTDEESLATMDSDLAVGPLSSPAWWSYQVHTEEKPVPKPAPPKQPSPQVTIDELLPPPTPFAQSEALKARAPASQRQVVVRAVELLVQHKGAVTEETFSQGVGILSYRVPGHVATLAEILNVDGYDVIRYDSEGRQVYLDIEKLKELFEVEL